MEKLDYTQEEINALIDFYTHSGYSDQNISTDKLTENCIDLFICAICNNNIYFFGGEKINAQDSNNCYFKKNLSISHNYNKRNDIKKVYTELFKQINEEKLLIDNKMHVPNKHKLTATLQLLLYPYISEIIELLKMSKNDYMKNFQLFEEAFSNCHYDKAVLIGESIPLEVQLLVLELYAKLCYAHSRIGNTGKALANYQIM